MGNELHGKRLPSVDGWRAASISMVLLHHGHMAVTTNPPGPVLSFFADGNLGVRFFFVISGFLISWLLLQEKNQSGNVSLKNFYIRRFLRILPVYFVFVLVLLSLQLFSHFRETPAGWWGMLTFTRNFTDGPAMNASMGSEHLWSLAVEEQFYLLWPGLFLLVQNRGLRLRMAVLALPIVTAPIFRLGTYLFLANHEKFSLAAHGIHAPGWLLHLVSDNSFFCNDDSLAFGCLAAILLFNYRQAVAAFLMQRRTTVFLSGFLLVVGPSLPFQFGMNGVIRVFVATYGNTLQALGFCLLLVQSILAPNWGIYRLLNWKWVCWVGVLSYSLYIWQQIFYFRIWEEPDIWRTQPNLAWAWLCVLPAFAAAITSFYGLERPFFRLRAYFRQAGNEMRKTPAQEGAGNPL